MDDEYQEFCGVASPRGKDGFCSLPAGAGTYHKGEGACYRHGGSTGSDVGKKHAPALERAARKIGTSDLTSLLEMSNKGLVLARALAVQRMLSPEATSKEISDCSMAVQRIDKVLADYDIEDLMGDTSTDEDDPLDEEAKRLADILSIVPDVVNE